MIELKKSTPGFVHQNRILLIMDETADALLPLSDEERAYVREKLKLEQRLIEINRYSSKLLIVGIPPAKEENQALEAWRRQGNEVAQWAKKEKITSVEITSLLDSSPMDSSPNDTSPTDTSNMDAPPMDSSTMGTSPNDSSPKNDGSPTDSMPAGTSRVDGTAYLVAFTEGILLGAYQFLKYQSKTEKIKNTLQEICFAGEQLSDIQISDLTILTNAVFDARDLVNEPVISLNAVQFGEILQSKCQEAGIHTEVLGKEQIEALGMGGLLAVNKGSLDPPTFSILEWKPENALNSKPVVLVGKGVVFDTGGLSLKPTAKSMDYMKCDMAGAAAVAGAIQVAALQQMPLHLVVLVPATDNRPGGNAITPGDVITISNGSTVEVLNTDAEGRLILADALTYAKKYNPMLVIDLATLTGSAAMTLGIHGIAAMGIRCRELFGLLKESGERVNERMVELPLWDEYDEMIKSNIADMKNIGGGEAGAITAGKFLQRFVDYPWIHLDIAGPSFLHTPDNYRPAGGTATGVRLLTDFLQTLVKQLSSGSISKE